MAGYSPVPLSAVRVEIGHSPFQTRRSLGDGRRDLDRFGSRIGTRLDHAVLPDKEFGMRIDGEPIKQGLQFGPQAVAAKSRDGMKFTHVIPLCVWDTIGIGG